MFRVLKIAMLAIVLGVSAASIAAATPQSASASVESGEARSQAAAEASFMAQLHPKTGNISLAQADATLALGDKYYFLDAADARKVIVDAWGNPPSVAEDVLGMIVPAGKTPFNDWGAVVTYEKTDYVSDKDAETTNYDEYLQEIQKGEPDTNKAREKDGYPTMQTVGWAQPPSYNKVHHYMIWAQDIRVGGKDVHTLNYDIRVLGRRGVLSLNMIATMPELESIRGQAEQLALAGTYNTGARYADYKEGDPTAAYGVGGLVAAGLGLAAAKKLGLLGLILAFGKKAFVFILAGLGIAWRWLTSLFGAKKTPGPSKHPAFDSSDVEVMPSDASPADNSVATEQEPTVRKSDD